MRKVVEVTPALHRRIKRAAIESDMTVLQYATVLLAWALEHQTEALSEADRLLVIADEPITYQPSNSHRLLR